MAEKRKRGQNFSHEEKDKLVKILLGYKETILNKKTDGTTNEAKVKAWISITDIFNSTATVFRNKESLMRVWEKLKSDSKIYYTDIKKSNSQTGGGPINIRSDPILDQVCAIIGRGCTGILGVADCDAEEAISDSSYEFMQIKRTLPELIVIPTEEVENVSKSISIDETSQPKNTDDRNKTPLWSKRTLPELKLIPTEEVENVSKSISIDETSQPKNTEDRNKTPMWSRRRPQLNKKNERSEAVASLCSSYKDVNKKKESLEELKIQLLKSEIQFKNSLYELQLEAARREVEIKNEVLAQIRCGGLNVENLFGIPTRTELNKY